MSMKKECHILKNDVLINDQEEQKEYTDYFSFENLQILLEEQIKILKDTFNITAEKLNDKLTEMTDIIILQRIQSEENTRLVQRFVYVITHCIAIYVVHYDTIPIHIHITNNRCLDTGFETTLHTSCFLHIYTRRGTKYKY